jgi:RNA polymerase sigma-70 factor (ECF subfamily)
MTQAVPGDVTQLLDAWRKGDKTALDRLMPLVYDQLRELASRQFARERTGHTLQTTALVHDAYLRLVGANVNWEDRAHFFGVAARAMRQLLVEHARGQNREKRGGGRVLLSLDEDVAAYAAERPAELLDLDEAMTRLAAMDNRKARVVELHYFTGLEYEEIAKVLEISPATVHRDLRMAKAWLQKELSSA